MPFSRNLRFSHTMATDSSDQLNFNPTTTTEENPKQTLDDDTTLTSISSLQLHVNTGQNSGFNSPLSNSLCSVSYVSFQTNKRRKKENPKGSTKKKNRENLKTLFVLCNNRRFRCYPIPSLQQQTIQKVGFDSGNWLPSNYEVLLRKVFDDCTKVLLSLSLRVCLFSVWVLRKCVKIKSFEFLDMVFDWLWWGFRLLGFEKMRERK